MAGAATDAGDAALAARHATGSGELASGAATDAGDAALAARSAAGATVDPSGSAVAVAVAVAAAGLFGGEESDCCGGRCRAGRRDGIGCDNRCCGDRSSDSPSHHQWFDEV
ncbi:hypothetical protein NJB1907f34b_05460 [Mycobacterium marinum]|nr:hypothetical protein NJB1907f34b_05460 [Mycobacterium marinum]